MLEIFKKVISYITYVFGDNGCIHAELYKPFRFFYVRYKIKYLVIRQVAALLAELYCQFSVLLIIGLL